MNTTIGAKRPPTFDPPELAALRVRHDNGEITSTAFEAELRALASKLGMNVAAVLLRELGGALRLPGFDAPHRPPGRAIDPPRERAADDDDDDA